jgi:hypothetical protein
MEEENKANTEKPLEKMTAKELREIATKIPGVQGVHAMKKEEVLALIKEYRGTEDKEEPKKKKAAKEPLGSKELKAKIADLRQQKEQARERKDRKKIAVFRRRINRLKKRTRQAAHS